MKTKADFGNRSRKAPGKRGPAHPIIITKIGLVALLVTCVGFTALAQSFYNLDFEQASLIPIYGDPYGRVAFGAALPGWTGYCGTDVQTAANYDFEFLDSPGISILDNNYTNLPISGLIHGRYCVLLQTGEGFMSPFVATAIAQTATVPADARSIIFNAGLISSITNLAVTFNGAAVPLVVLTAQPNYVVLGGDVSQFAGQSGELRFTAPVLWNGSPPQPYWNDVLLDYICFSNSPLALPPTILTPPQGQTADVGAAVDFTVSADGAPPPAYLWFFNGTNALSGATSSDLHLTNLQLSQSGTYTVVVTNAFGAVTSPPATLSVIGSYPTILRSPRSQTGIVGRFAEFTVSAGSTLPLTYQWFFNGSAISGAGGTSLHMSNLQVSEAGTYNVIVTNALAAVTSPPAALTVIAVPTPTSGTVAAWGDNSHGQCAVPAGLSNVIAVAAGYWHSLALKSDDAVVGWGDEPGAGESTVPAGLSNVVSIAAGDYYSLALKSDGTVVGWSSSWVPAGLSGVLAIAAGSAHSLALKSDGTVVAWGDNSFNQTAVPADLSDVLAISAGYHHSLALKSDGTVVAWGAGGPGQFKDPHHGQSIVPAGLGEVIALAGGGYHSLALKSNGTVVAWGDNYDDSGHFVGQSTVPAGLGGVIAIAAGQYHSLALKSDGTVVAWGDNAYGQIAVPATLGGVIAIATEGLHSLALVAGPPSLLTPPASQTAEIGSTVWFRVTADGYPPLAYGWFFNGTTLLGGATNSVLQLADVRSSQTGAYTVVVTNIAGAVTSPPAVLSVIPAVERRLVPALTLMGRPGSSLNLQDAEALTPSPPWATFDNVALTNTSQWYFDLSTPLPPQRFYRAWQPGPSSAAPALDLHMAPALTLTGAVGSTVRVDCINQFGPTDAWVTLDTVTLTNTSQLYFDVSAIGQPLRLWRIVPVP
jgi:alpha-tubulin suppressor-like RCC1 family protein